MALTDRERSNIANLLAQVGLAEQAATALRYSFDRRPALKSSKEEIEPEEWERWDALTARFARLSDLLIQRVFRAVDSVEFLAPDATLIDRLNRAEKRGHIDATDQWKEIREARNEIVHEYASENILRIIRDVIELAPSLLETVERLEDYALLAKKQLDKDS